MMQGKLLEKNMTKDFPRSLTKDAMDSKWYQTFGAVQYSSLKEYDQYENIILRLSGFMTMYRMLELNGNVIENRPSITYSSFIINHAYHSGIKPLWVSKSLMQAFSYSKLPDKINVLNRICPVGLILVPPLIKNEIGKYLKWVLFYHKLPGDQNIPLALTNKYTHFYEEKVFNPDKEVLYFMTEVGGVLIIGSRDISVVDNKLGSYEDAPFVLYGKEKRKEVDQKDYPLVTKIPDLIIQTLLYMQMEKIVLPPLPNPEPLGFGRNSKTKYKKIPPLIIGENYLIKTRTEATGESRPHGSPVTHWRSGHWRCQPCGSKDNRNYKTIWIEPMLINKPV